MVQPYHYVRFTWWKNVDLRNVERELDAAFSVESIEMPGDDREFSLYKEMRGELKVRADTLGAILSPVRAVLFQREAMPFTARDVELRRRILKLYPRNTPTPLPLFFSEEPKFDVAGQHRAGQDPPENPLTGSATI